MMLKKISVFAVVALMSVVLLGCSDQSSYESGEEGPVAAPPAVVPEVEPPPAASDAGGEGLACRADGSCDEGLVCGADEVCAKVAAGEECKGGCPRNHVCRSGRCLNEVFLGGSGSSGSGGGKESSASKCPDDMAYIAGATFQMGSDEDDSSDNEVHQVKLSAFCMDKYEFTNADLKRLKKAVTDLGTGILWPPDPVSDFGGDDQPLVNVNWNEADAICKELGKALPTEAQWEHAAKTDRDCEYGTKSCNIDPTQADACFSPNGSDPKEATCEVGSTNKPNSFGLHDMSGNVWEWVADWYEDSYGAEAVADPTGPDSGTYKVLRGGSWFLYYHPFLRAAFRLSSAPDYRGNIIGFRCAASPQN